MRLRRAALALAACASPVVAGCSSSGTPTTTTTSSTRSSSTTATTGSSTTTTGSTTTTSVTAACAHVSATAGQSQGAAGTITGLIDVTNTGPSTCAADGYPMLGLASGSGAPLTVTLVDGLSVSLSPAANAAPTEVLLLPSASAEFAYQYSDVPVGNETSCPTSEQATVTMPGASTASPAFALRLAPCNDGTVRVSPVYAG